MSSSSFSNPHTILKKLIFLILVTFLLTGCAKLVETEQPAVVDWEKLSAGNTIGQTFVGNYNGLTGIYFFLAPQKNGSGEIRLHLRSDAMALEDLAESVNKVAIEQVETSGYYGFFVPAQLDSNQKYYYAYLEITGSGELYVGKTSGDAYLNGSLHRNGIPEDAQAAFQLSYSRRSAIPGLALEFAGWSGILVLGVFLFILPGWGLFSMFWPDWGRLVWPEKLGLSAGLSLAIYPLLMIWTNIIGLHLGAMYAWLPPFVGLGMILWRNFRRPNMAGFKHSHIFTWKRINLSILPDIAFLIMLGYLIITRFWGIRSLEMPMWGDSYQHTMIAQLILDHGGLFSSWQPYADLASFTYHFGFHSSVAVFDWITHLDMPRAVLWVGQILNILAVIVLYPLATKIGRNSWAGVVAVLVAGLLSPLPMFYVNWGRYTQLAGQVILPVVMWVLWNALLQNSFLPSKSLPAREKGSAGKVIIACIALSGLSLTHYRVLIFGILFMVILWIIYCRRDSFKEILLNTIWIGIGAGLLFLPWFIHAFGGKLLSIFTHQITTSAAESVEADPQLAGIGNLLVYLPSILWILLLVVICIGLLRREKGSLLISLWWLAILLAGNPSWLGLPGAGVVNNFTVSIAIYIPASILTGAFASWVIEHTNTKRERKNIIRLVSSLVVTILIIGFGLWGASQRINEVQPLTYALATRPDILAAAWIRENTPPETRLLVNSFPAFNNYVIVGSDGGWWLPLLAGRMTTVPPINYGFEKDPSLGFSDKINALTFEIQEKGIQHITVLSQLQTQGISYAYVGQRQGLVNSGGPLFTVEQLLADPHFQTVYNQDRVWIFQIRQTP